MAGRFRSVERALLVIGICLLSVYVAARLDGEVLRRLGLWQFKNDRGIAKGNSIVGVGADPAPWQTERKVAFSLWSSKRVSRYKEALLAKFDSPLAILSIPRLELEVPVFDGIDDLTLNRGVGWIRGTTRPGESGSIAIAGHRDGFFRSLKDIQVGDTIRLLTAAQTDVYKVQHIKIVGPDDVRVLQAGPRPSLILVTCYPFYFVSDAPQRYIVTAQIANSELTPASGNVSVDPAVSKNNKENMR